MRDIVVGIDGSTESGHALDRALRLGQRTGRRVVVAHVWTDAAGLRPEDVPATLSDPRSAASALVDAELAQALGRLEDATRVRFRDHVVPGRSGPVLTQLSADAALVVIGTHAEAKLLTLLGSTVAHTLHHAICPVMLVPPLGESTRAFRRVVVGVDGSAGSRAALRWAVELAGRDRAAVEVLHVVPDEDTTLAEAKTALRSAVPEVDDEGIRLRVVQGDPATVLSRAAGRQDVLVVGSRGTGGFPALVLGAVSAHVVTVPESPVVVVRAGEERLDDVVGQSESERLVQ
jgi:nucleotide-binding universal stress UspA family protein